MFDEKHGIPFLINQTKILTKLRSLMGSGEGQKLLKEEAAKVDQKANSFGKASVTRWVGPKQRELLAAVQTRAHQITNLLDKAKFPKKHASNVAFTKDLRNGFTVLGEWLGCDLLHQLAVASGCLQRRDDVSWKPALTVDATYGRFLEMIDSMANGKTLQEIFPAAVFPNVYKHLDIIQNGTLDYGGSEPLTLDWEEPEWASVQDWILKANPTPLPKDAASEKGLGLLETKEHEYIRAKPEIPKLPDFESGNAVQDARITKFRTIALAAVYKTARIFKTRVVDRVKGWLRRRARAHSFESLFQKYSTEGKEGYLRHALDELRQLLSIRNTYLEDVGHPARVSAEEEVAECVEYRRKLLPHVLKQFKTLEKMRSLRERLATWTGSARERAKTNRKLGELEEKSWYVWRPKQVAYELNEKRVVGFGRTQRWVMYNYILGLDRESLGGSNEPGMESFFSFMANQARENMSAEDLLTELTFLRLGPPMHLIKKLIDDLEKRIFFLNTVKTQSAHIEHAPTIDRLRKRKCPFSHFQ